MSAAKHQDDHMFCQNCGGFTGQRTHSCGGNFQGPEDRLRDSASDLLKALQRVLAAIDRMPSNPADGIAEECRAAIAKATGE